MPRPSTPPTYAPTHGYLPPAAINLLFMQWIHHLASRDLGLGQYGTTGATSEQAQVASIFSFTDNIGKGFRLTRTEDDRAWRLDVDDGYNADSVAATVEAASDSASRPEYGDDVCYSSTLTSEEPQIGGGFGLHFMRSLGTQQAILGHRRLGARVLLEFVMEGPENPQPLFVPKTTINVSIFTPGPGPGPLSQEIAEGLLEVIRVVCAFALGRPVDSPGMIFPADDDKASEALARRTDLSILGLARNSQSLDVFDELIAFAGTQAALKVRGSLVAYEAALRQTNADVATILFVSAMEALIAPSTEWRRNRTVARFKRAVSELCTPAIDSLLAHANVEEAFAFKKRGGTNRQRKDLLDRIYDMRSRPVHSGLDLMPGFMRSMTGSGSMRIALLSDLYHAMLLVFLQAPRSFLTGHPLINTAPAGPSAP